MDSLALATNEESPRLGEQARADDPERTNHMDKHTVLAGEAPASDVATELGQHAGRLGAWVTSKSTGTEFFVDASGISNLTNDLIRISSLLLDLEDLGLSLSVRLSASEESDGLGELADSPSESGRGSFVLSVQPLRSGGVGISGGLVGLRSGVDESHDSSPSVGGPASVRDCGCGASEPTGGEAGTSAGTAGVA